MLYAPTRCARLAQVRAAVFTGVLEKVGVFGMQPRYYIVRIYRRSGGALPEVLVGAVEDMNGRRWSFRTTEELVRILSMHSERSPDANETYS